MCMCPKRKQTFNFSQLVFSLKSKIHGGEAPLKFCWQSVSGNYLATVGNDNVVRIWDRHGQRIEEFQVSGLVCCKKVVIKKIKSNNSILKNGSIY